MLPAAGRAAVAALLLGGSAAAAAPAPPGAGPAAAGPAPSFEEVMAAERTLGAVRVSPDGRRLLVSVERHDRPTEGVPWKVTATQALVLRLDGPGRPAGGGEPVFGPDGAFLPALCDPWSPTGRFVVGLVARDGQRRLATWRPDARSGRTLDAPPLTMCPSWAGERLVYPAPAEGGSDLASAAPAAASLLARWRRAWTQDAPQVTVHSNVAAFPAPEPPSGRLVLADPATGAQTVLGRGDFHSITPSPDGAVIAVVRAEARDPQALSRQSGRRGDLQLYPSEAPGPPIAPLPGFDVDYAGLAWSPDGRRLLVAGRDTRTGALGLVVLARDGTVLQEIRPPPQVRLGHGRRGAFSVLRPIGWVDDRPAFIAATRDARALPPEGRSDYGEAAGLRFGVYVAEPAGVRALTAGLDASVTAFATGVDGRAMVAAEGALWALAASGERQRLSPPGLVVERLAEARPSYGLPPRFAVAADRAAVIARRNGRPVLAVVNLTTRRVVLERPAATLAALSPDLRTALEARADGWARRLQITGGRAPLLTLNAAWSGRAVAKPVPFTYTALGRSLTGWALLPPGRGPAPAIVWIYGGDVQGATPPAAALPGRQPTPLVSGQLWAARGYAVIYPSTPLPAGAEADIPAILAAQTEAATAAAAARGWIDPGRVGLIGHSFGGYSVAAVLSRSPRFAAGVALSGPYDFVAAWGARQPLEALTDVDGYGFVEETVGFVEAGQIALQAPPYAALEAYRRNSPLFAASTLTAPLLLMAGDLDQGAAGLSQAERLYAALTRAGRPAAMVRYWGQDHVQDDPWAVRDQWGRATAWFDRHLAPCAEAPLTSDRPAACEGPAPASASRGPRTPASPPS